MEEKLREVLRAVADRVPAQDRAVPPRVRHRAVRGAALTLGGLAVLAAAAGLGVVRGAAVLSERIAGQEPIPAVALSVTATPLPPTERSPGPLPARRLEARGIAPRERGTGPPGPGLGRDQARTTFPALRQAVQA